MNQSRHIIRHKLSKRPARDCWKCMLYNCLSWYKFVNTHLYHSRQLYNTLTPPSHESPAVGLRISRLSGSVELTLRYTTPDIHCRHRRHECDGGILCSRLYLSVRLWVSLISLRRVQCRYFAPLYRRVRFVAVSAAVSHSRTCFSRESSWWRRGCRRCTKTPDASLSASLQALCCCCLMVLMMMMMTTMMLLRYYYPATCRSRADATYTEVASRPTSVRPSVWSSSPYQMLCGGVLQYVTAPHGTAAHRNAMRPAWMNLFGLSITCGPDIKKSL